jgi:uncharacterized protein (TIGR00730 family)
MRITVYAGSAIGHDPSYRTCATEFAGTLALAGAEIVYGGGRVGLMGAVADAALKAGGRVIGVIPQALLDAEIAHPGLTELRVVPGMGERKQLMAQLADCFVALPGSAGTLEELSEVWAQLLLGIHAKPVLLLNHAGFWDPLLAMADQMCAGGYLRSHERASLHTITCASDLFTVLDHWAPPVPRWNRPASRVTELEKI